MSINEIPEDQMAIIRTQKPYLINALRQWALDRGSIPHMLVDATWPGCANLPANLIHERLVLNVSYKACEEFHCDHEGISGKMAFSGIQRQLFIPIGAVRSIYCPDLGNVGMSFDSFEEEKPTGEELAETETPAPKERPSFLQVVK